MQGGFRFSEIEQCVPPSVPGVYQIRMIRGTKLKAGIGGDLLRRLKTHRASRQSGLLLRLDGDWSNPSDVESKASILAKHLYFDEVIAPGYDLKSETGRQQFLEDCCVIDVQLTASRDEARHIEADLEASGGFRYQGDVVQRLAGEGESQESSAVRTLVLAALILLVVAIIGVVWAARER